MNSLNIMILHDILTGHERMNNFAKRVYLCLMRHILTFILFFTIAFQVLAQPTRKDVLRGGERAERSCFDVTYYDLYIDVDIIGKAIQGRNVISFTVLDSTQRIQLDLFENMLIDAISIEDQMLNYTRDFDAVFIDLGRIYSPGAQVELQVFFHGSPRIAKMPPWDGGFTWTKDASGKDWIAVSCQGIGASLWWPTKEVYSDEPLGMKIHCTVPSHLYAVCNGQEEPEIVNENGTSTYNWEVTYPINNYNVTLNIGDYVHFSDTYESPDGQVLALDYYVLPPSLDKAKVQFEQVKPMLACYEKFLGKYPFWDDGYALVETPYLGMEHQGAIAYGNKFKRGYMGMDRSGQDLDFDYIIIHETGHEWWGNSVSCEDLADMWIHESFCTYSEAIYVECRWDYETAITYVNALKNTVANTSPIIGVYGLNKEGHSDMYVKGMLFLNTLRHVLNDDEKWWAMIKNMSDKEFKIRTTNYDEVVGYFNKESGKDLSKIFEQYVKFKDIPVLQVKEKKKGKKYVQYACKWKTDVKDFNMPVAINLNGQITYYKCNSKKPITITVPADAVDVFDQEVLYYQLQMP